MRVWIAALGVAASLVLASSCGGKDGPTGVSVNVSGSWAGSGSQGGYTFGFMMTITEAGDGSITGNGTATSFTGGGNGVSYTVAGSRSGSSVTLELDATGLEPPTYKGGLNDENTLWGRLNGSGFNNMQVTLVRS